MNNQRDVDFHAIADYAHLGKVVHVDRVVAFLVHDIGCVARNILQNSCDLFVKHLFVRLLKGLQLVFCENSLPQLIIQCASPFLVEGFVGDQEVLNLLRDLFVASIDERKPLVTSIGDHQERQLPELLRPISLLHDPLFVVPLTQLVDRVTEEGNGILDEGAKELFTETVHFVFFNILLVVVATDSVASDLPGTGEVRARLVE